MGSNAISCNSCNELLTMQQLLPHVQEVHHGPPAFEMVRVACSQCSFKVSKEKLNLMLDHCRLTKHEPADVDLQDWEEFICAEQIRTRAILKEALDLLIAHGESNPHEGPHRTSQTSGHPAPTGSSTPLPGMSKNGSIGKTPKPVPGQKQRRSLQQVLPTPSPRPDSKRPLSTESASEIQTDEAPDGSYEDPPQPKKTRSSKQQPATDEASSTSCSADSVPQSPISEQQQSSGMHNCSYCNKPVRVRDGYEKLVQHVLAHEHKVKAFKCSECDTRSGRRTYIQQHLKMKKCGGTLLNTMKAESAPLLRQMLAESFQDVDWDLICATGIPGFVTEAEPVGVVEEESGEEADGAMESNSVDDPDEQSQQHHSYENNSDEVSLVEKHLVKTEAPTENEEEEGWNNRQGDTEPENSEAVEEEMENSADEEAHSRQVEEEVATKKTSKKFETEQCQICNEDVKASQNAGLVRHLLGHESLKPYGCNGCEFRATSRCAVKTHSRKANCSSGISLEFSQEQRDRVKSQLEIAFPTICWEKKLHKGIPGFTLKDN